MERVAASIVSILFGSLFYLPWIFIRLGKYKLWYLAHRIPPFSWPRVMYALPAFATMFILLPFVALLPISNDAAMAVLGVISVIGVILGFILMIWTPRWAQPDWQFYLEGNFEWSEIKRVFIPYWRQMDRRTWISLMDSEEGIDELVRLARKAAKD
jgi:hypothetical protein